MPYTATPILTPGSIKGLASKPHPATLPNGIAARLQNIRLDTGVVAARSGDELIAEMLPGSIRGAFECSLDGTRSLFRAAASSGLVTVYRSIDAGTTWASITPSTGPYGDTRLEDTGQPIRFQVARDRGYGPDDVEHDLLVIQDGVSNPRIYGPPAEGSTAFDVADTAVVAQPSQVENTARYKISLPSWFDLTEAPTISNETGITAASDGSDDIYLTIANTYAAGNTTTVQFSSPLDLSGSPQAILHLGSATENFWKQVRLELGNGTEWTTLLDDSIAGDAVWLPSRDTPPLVADWFIVGVPVDPAGITSGDRFRLTWLGDIPGSTIDAWIGMFASGGSYPAASQFATALAQTDTRTLGPGVIVSTILDATTSEFGNGVDQYKTVIPPDPRLFVNFTLLARNPLHLEIRKGVDRLYIYRRLPGEQGYYLITQHQLAAWSGTDWDYTDDVELHFVSVDATGEEDLARPAPDSATLCMPAGTAMAAATGRLFVGDGSRLWWSETERPTQFRKAVRFVDVSTPDPTSAGSFAVDGEQLQAIIPMGSASVAEELSAPITGAAALVLLSDRNAYALAGADPSSLSRPIALGPHGTLSPLSPARSLDGLYWLDQRGQVVHLAAGKWSTPARGRVDDMTTAVEPTRIQWGSGACARDRYHLAITPTGETANTAVLVWSEQLNAWESIDTSASPAEILIPYQSGSAVDLLRFGPTDVFNHAKPGSTEPVVLDLQLRAITLPTLRDVEVGQMQVWSDGGSYELTTNRVSLADGTSSSATIAVADANCRLRAEASSAGLQALAIQPGLAGTVPGGTKVLALIAMLGHTTSSAAA